MTRRQRERDPKRDSRRTSRDGRLPIFLTTGCDAVRLGHPWVFRDAAVRRLGEIPGGTEVAVHDARDRSFLAWGLFEPEGPIAVRLFSRDPKERFDLGSIVRRLEASLARRRGLFDEQATTCSRLVNGEADGLPGLVVDRFSEFTVIQPYCDLWTPDRLPLEELVAASPGGVLLRDRRRGAGGAVHIVSGSLPPPGYTVRERGLTYVAFTQNGRKPGLFLDHRDNRTLVSDYLAGKRWLNAFSYTAGFTIAAAAAQPGGLSINLDQSAWCHDIGRRNLEVNGIPLEGHTFVTDDTASFLETYDGQRFDAVILDPPSFSTSRKGAQSTLRDTPDLVRLAARVLRRDGILVLASNNSKVTWPELFRLVATGMRSAEKTLRILETRGLPRDFPTLPAFPEGQYLKLLVGMVSEN